MPNRDSLSDRSTSARFSIRWDATMGCYRVSVPELSQDGERIEVMRHDAIPNEYDLGAMIYYLDRAAKNARYDSGTSEATRAEMERLVDDLKTFRLAAYFPRPTAGAFGEETR